MVDRLVNSEANAHRIAVVESCFGSSGQPLAVPGRVLVGEGVLTKMCRKKGKPRQFFLFNDILVYGNIVISKKKYNKQHIIPLEEVKLDSLDDNDQHRNGWVIQTATKSFAVYAATPVEKEEWVAHINKCVGDLLRKSGKKASEVHAAVWIPDTEADVCMHCKKTQFTLLTRRHHCRKCGSVVCGPCSNKKFLLPNQSSKPLRVCLNCYDSLSKARSSQNSSGESLSGKDGKDSRNRLIDSSGEDDSDDDDNGNNKSSDQSHDQHPRLNLPEIIPKGHPPPQDSVATAVTTVPQYRSRYPGLIRRHTSGGAMEFTESKHQIPGLHDTKNAHYTYR